MSSVSASTIGAHDLLALFRQRVAEDLLLLATLHEREPDKTLLEEIKALDFPLCLTLLPETGPGFDALKLMRQTLVDLPKTLDDRLLDELAADYASIYLNHNISASPEESVWLDEDSLKYQDSMFQVRAWYESCGLAISDWRIRPDDHLVYQLQFIAALLKRDEKTETLVKTGAFMDEHLLRWLGNFAERVLGRCDTAYFGALAGLSASYCESLRDNLAEILEQPRPRREDIEQRMKPKPGQQEVSVSFMPGVGPVV